MVVFREGLEVRVSDIFLPSFCGGPIALIREGDEILIDIPIAR
jgi:hypothetical protein